MLVSTGFVWLAGRVKGIAILAAAGFAMMFILFSNTYFREFPERIGPVFYESLGRLYSMLRNTAPVKSILRTR